MRSTPSASHAADRSPDNNRLVLIVVGTLIGGICFGAVIDRALWATEQAARPPTIVQCPPAPTCPACPPATCPTLPPCSTTTAPPAKCPSPNICLPAPACPACPSTTCPAPSPCSTTTTAPPAECPSPNICPSCPDCRSAAACPPVGNPLPLASTIWNFSGSGWHGFVDFRGDGRYWTHWGYGHWQLNGDVLTMRNDYDPFSFEIRIRDGNLSGRRSDGDACSGHFMGRYGR